jgi:hypothetical protein
MFGYLAETSVEKGGKSQTDSCSAQCWKEERRPIGMVRCTRRRSCETGPAVNGVASSRETSWRGQPLGYAGQTATMGG